MARFPLRGGRSYWTTPVAIQSIDQSNVFEHVFSVNDARGLGASELHVGSAPPIDEADNLIFHEFVDLVCERGLHGLFELQRVMDRGVDMVEFVFDTGMFLVEQELVEEEVLLEGATQCTGWVATRHGGVIEYKGNRICAPHPQYGHLRLTDGKVCNGEDAIRSLNADGSLKNGAFA